MASAALSLPAPPSAAVAAASSAAPSVAPSLSAPASAASAAKCSQCRWHPQVANADGLCLECQQWHVATDVGGIPGRSLVVRRDLAAGVCVLTEPSSMWQCAIDPAVADLRRLDRAPDLWAAHQQLLAQLALVYDQPAARAEIDSLCTADAASYLSHRGDNSLHAERQAYIAMTRDFATTYSDQFPGVSTPEQMVGLMVRIRLNSHIVRKTTPAPLQPQVAEAASSAAVAAAAAAAPIVTAVSLCLPRLLSGANHSCAPNCIVLQSGRRLVSLRSIASGDPLTVSYLPLHQLRAWDTVARRARLWEDYLFVCTCPRCGAGEKVIATAPAQGQGEALAEQDWQKLLSAMDAAVALDAAQQEVAAAAASAGVRSLVVSRCSVCAKATDQRCSRCKTVHFCSRDCQQLAWRDHKAECKAPAAAAAAAKNKQSATVA